MSALFKPASAPPQLEAHQQISLFFFFFQHTSLGICKPHSGSPNPRVCFPICVPSLPGREEETTPSPNPGWAVLPLSSNPPHSPGAGTSTHPSPCFARSSTDAGFIPILFPGMRVHIRGHTRVSVRAPPAERGLALDQLLAVANEPRLCSSSLLTIIIIVIKKEK